MNDCKRFVKRHKTEVSVLLKGKCVTHKVENRLVSIHEPHVRPIARGKARAKNEFGAKIYLSLIDSIVFLDTLS